MNPTDPSFERLERTITMIAGHANYQGKGETIAECLEEIEYLWGLGMLDMEQRRRLRSILLRGRTSRLVLKLVTDVRLDP